MTRTILIITAFFLIGFSNAQKQVAITMDDLPGYSVKDPDERLLQLINSRHLPITIFINGMYLDYADSVQARKTFSEFASCKYVTVGNHTYSHPWYHELEFSDFTANIEKNQQLINHYIAPFHKKSTYFKFPFNDLGKDSIQNAGIKKYLKENGYVIAPYIVESSDWAFSTVYELYLKNNNKTIADSIGELYVAKTMEFFSYFENLSQQLYGRQIKMIYQSHDNILNAVYLPQILELLSKRGYTFISLKEALKDNAYKSRDYFANTWGISWIYRWIKDEEKRKELQRSEPDNSWVEKKYRELNSGSY